MNPVRETPYASFWQSLETSAETSSNALESSARSVNWTIENRGGVAKLIGFTMVPSQFLGPELEVCKMIIDIACHNNFNIKKFEEGVICYPLNWNQDDFSRCVLYHNPNGITVAQYFEKAQLTYTPADILKKEKCPIILYDYRGTGLNREMVSNTSLQFRPTYETVVQDGNNMLDTALTYFKHVDVWGSSLGGGVATASLERYLSKNPQCKDRVTLHNHDSFTVTGRVVMPSVPMVADAIGWLVGGNLDAQTPMASLIDRGIKVTVLCHNQDPVIPEGARMAEFVEQYAGRDNVSIVTVPSYGHANLSADML